MSISKARYVYKCDGQSLDTYCPDFIQVGELYTRQVAHGEIFRFCQGCTPIHKEATHA